MPIPPPAALALATALASAPSVPLVPGTREVFALTAGHGRRHHVLLEAGRFLQVTVHQRGGDVVVRLVAPDGRVIEDRVDASEGPTGREPASILASEGGPYAIEVWAPDDVGPGERYEIDSELPRTPTARDRQRLEAERLTAEGGRVIPPRAHSSHRTWPTLERLAASVATFDAALSAWAPLREPCWQAEAEMSRAWSSHHAHGWYQSSLDHYLRALELWQTCGDDQKFGETVLFAGRLFVLYSRYAEAAETYEFGLALSADLDPILRAQFMVQLANTYGLLGDTERAIRHGESVLPFLRERGFEQGQAVTLTHLANAHYRRGELDRASEYAMEALVLRRVVGNEQGLAETLVALGDIFAALGEPERALAYLDEAIARWGFSHWGWEMDARSRTAAILIDAGRPQQAMSQLERAIALGEWDSGARHQVRIRLQLARVLMTAGNWKRARENVDATLALVGRAGDRFGLGEAQELSGRLYLQAGDRIAAATALGESLALRRSVGDRVGEATALRFQAQLARASGDLEGARGLLQDARAIVETQRGMLPTPQLRASWAGTVRAIDEEHVDVLMALHRLRPHEGFAARAFEASESASARSLLDLLAEPPASPEAATAELVSRERSARGRLTGALDRQVLAQAQADPAARAALAHEVQDLSAAHERALAALRAGDARSAAWTRPVPLGLAQLQAEVLEADTTLLEFSLGEERGHAWVVGRDRLDTYELPARARVEAAVAAVQRALSARPSAEAPGRAAAALRSLAALVLPKDRSLLRGARLVVVADGALHHVPFAALPDASGAPLVARFEVASAPSASVAAELRRQVAGRAPAPRGIAVIADPVYDVADERLRGAAGTRLADARFARATRDFGFVDGRLPRLPFTRREALSIAALAPGDSRIALDFGANLDAALRGDLASYRYVHFAAHGLLNDARPELSGLVLSLVDAQGKARAGLLTAPDVSSIRLGADLVVLSGCRSAAGREVRGEGLVGLARAFVYAGSPRVVASLWPVDDLASAELMTAMYRGMLGPSKLSPAAALRRAQLAMLGHRKWKAPYYWAGFQLQGEWR
jgi:CHAT domain-containing protein/tetratricopeptide (TPR) repeat protein